MRIIYFYAYIRAMKARVNLTIEEDILLKAKKYAAEAGTSISELVEDYLTTVTKPKIRSRGLLEMVDKLKPSNYPENYNFKEEYYKSKAGKNGH